MPWKYFWRRYDSNVYWSDVWLYGVELEGRCRATKKKEFKLPWREAGPPNHLNDAVNSDQQVVNK